MNQPCQIVAWKIPTHFEYQVWIIDHDPNMALKFWRKIPIKIIRDIFYYYSQKCHPWLLDPDPK
jgi:hypothetical protein